jgi:Fe-S oxidoreductase
MHGLYHHLPGKPGQSALSRAETGGPDGERLRLKDGALYDEALKYCINCKRCEVACPSDVKIGDIIQRARAQYGQQKPTLRDAILSHTDLMGTLSTPFAPLVNAATGLKPVRRLLDARSKSITAARCRNMASAPSAALTASSRPARRSTRAGGLLSWLLRQL